MTVRDPVCGMDIESQRAFAKREHMGQTFYFCSQSCVDQFDKDPHRYGRIRNSQSSVTLMDKQEEARVHEYRRLMNMFLFAAIVSLPVLLFANPQYIPFIRDLPMETIRLARAQRGCT